MDGIREIPCREVLQTVTGLFERMGVATESAHRAALRLIENEVLGHQSHGLMRVGEYLQEIKAGRIDPKAMPKVSRISSIAHVVDGCRSLGILAAEEVARTLISGLQDQPICCVALTNSAHLGRLHHLLLPIADAGLIALGFVNYLGNGKRVAPAGSTEPLLGTNPIAFAFPGSNGEPFIVDISTAVVSEGKIRAYLQAEEKLPSDLLVSTSGEVEYNPAKLYSSPAEAMLLPLGGMRYGYKGFLISMAVDMLAGALTGAGHSAQPAELPGNGGMFIGVRPDIFGQDPEQVSMSLQQIRTFCAKGAAKGLLRMPRTCRLEDSCMDTISIKVTDQLYRNLEEMKNERG